MAVHAIAMTYSVVEDETVVRYIIRHNADAIVSIRVSLEPIAVDYRMHTDWEDFIDGCLTVLMVAYATISGVRVSLVWN